MRLSQALPNSKQGLPSALRRVISLQKSEFIRIRKSVSHGAPHTVVPLKTRPVVPHTKTSHLGYNRAQGRCQAEPTGPPGAGAPLLPTCAETSAH